MNPSEQHGQDDLERRLREAFAAKALQVSDADLDHDREDEFAAALTSRGRRHPATRWFAGIGAAAAAAAIIGVTVVGLHDDGQRQVVNGLPPASNTTSASSTPSTSTGTSGSSPARETADAHRPATSGSSTATGLPRASTATSRSSASSSSTSTASHSSSRTVLSGGAARSSGPSVSANSSLSSTTDEPPTMPPELPQAGALGGQDYAGAVPLADEADGAPRMLAMPADTTWQRTGETGHSLTVRITYLPTDIEAYWKQTLPGEGWVADGAGWKFPGTSYAVSPITDKGSFTVTW